uniref:tetrahydrofolate synthase n=4 Tax=Arion vulgaris TaxID=1028688 RepID=A0A0B7AGQ5_9EUPU
MRDMMARLEKEGRLDMLFVMMNSFLRRGGIQDHELEKISVIHIAGTKGKGSTSAFTESILRHHGYRTGLFTSPHMYQIRERICINGRPISEEKFCQYFWEIFKNFEDSVFDSSIEEGGTMPGFFDLITVMALRVFISEGVDVIVLEVGKGGYTDRTNFVRRPVVCGITSLALEHTESLGNTIEKIAWHKAGIIKTGRPVVTLQQDPKALQVILDIAKQKKAPVFIALPLPQSVLDEYSFSLGIKGPIQVQNAGLAVQLFRAWETWRGVSKPELVNGVTKMSCIEDIPRLHCGALEMNVIKGLSTCLLHGRTEIIRRDHVTYYLDFAHTQESMEHCAAWFDKTARQEAATISGKVARVLQFYCLSVKDPQKLLPILKNVNFDGAAFSWSMASEDEPLGQHSDQRYCKISAEEENTLVQQIESVWKSLCDHNTSQDSLHKDTEQISEQGFYKKYYPDSNGHISSARVKQDILHEFDAANENDFDHITNGYDSFPTDTNILANGDGVHINGMDSGVLSANVRASSNLEIMNIASENEMQFSNFETEQIPVLANGKEHRKVEKECSTFECALQALVWATQGKDPAVASSLKAAKELLPVAPSSMREADHIQVLVTGSSKLCGVVLSVLLPNMNN